MSSSVHPKPSVSSQLLEGRASLVAFLSGGFGVLSGFAIFFLMLEKADEPMLFLGVLGLASVLSAIFEWLREQIEHPHGDTHSEDHGERSLTRFFVFLVILAVAEFHVMSWEALTQISASHEFSTVIFSLLGSSVTGSAGVYIDLAFLFGFWVLAGAVLAVALLSQLKTTEGTLRSRMFRGGGVGALTGALVAPLCLFGYVLLLWLVRGLYLLLFQPSTWQSNVRTLQDHASTLHNWIGLAFTFVFWLILKAASLFGQHPLGPVLAVLAAIVVVLVLARNETGLPALIVAVAVAAVVMAPLFNNLGAVLIMLLRAALVWVVPGVVLGAMSPLLRETSEEKKPKSWALVAFASAAVLFLITLLRFRQSWWLLLPAALLAAMGFALRRTSQAGPYWLPMAVSTGVLVWGAMLGVQSASSFAGVYDSMHQITTLPSELAPVPRPPKPKELADFEAAVTRLRMQNPEILNPSWAGMPGDRRAQSTATSAAALEAMENELGRMEASTAKWHGEIAAFETAAEHLHASGGKWFEHMTHLIEVHRGLSALIQKTDDTARAPLQELRAQILAIPPQTIGLGDLLPGSGGSPEAAARIHEASLAGGRLRGARTALLARVDASLAKLDDVMKALSAIESPIASSERSMRDTVIRWLELALAGSVGYWTAISLLVGWSMQQRKSSKA